MNHRFLAPLLLAAFALILRLHAAPAPGIDAGFHTLHGGLVICLGAEETAGPGEDIEASGRYLVHYLDGDIQAVNRKQQAIRARNLYGLVTAEHLPTPLQQLPYAEHTVNLILATKHGTRPPLPECFRVLTPEGVLITASDSVNEKALYDAGFQVKTDAPTGRHFAMKPWPDTMDGWTHRRHGADGNAVSTDIAVGPPRRVRWVAAATSEVEGMVTAGGRNFYGGILARDSFNGLRLWHHDTLKAQCNLPDFKLPRLPREGARPVATRKFVFAVVDKKLTALIAETGEVHQTFEKISMPTALVHYRDYVIATDDKQVHAFNMTTGKQIWNFNASAPRHLVAGGEIVSLVHGQPKRGEPSEAVTLDLYSGKVKWRKKDYDWLNRVSRSVLYEKQIAYESSTFNDHDAGNGLHVVSSETGELAWKKAYPPGMNHARQATALFLQNQLWILHGGKVNTANRDKMKRTPIHVSALNPATGETEVTHKAGLTHCFPPVATPEFLFSGELDMTDIKTGDVVANRITKANCSRENGWIPANGLIYTTPKHCTCWPMLRGYVAMAPEAEKTPLEHQGYNRVSGQAKPDTATPTADTDWPLYRSDRWRSGSTAATGPEALNIRWRTRIASETNTRDKNTPVLHDWRENPHVKSPLSAPVIAHGMVVVAQPDAQEVVAMDATTGEVRWRFTTIGRIDSPPALHRGLCIFGSNGGRVTALDIRNGELAWQLAPRYDQRIVAYGQVESSWPVPGAILVIGDTAYFAAGRQPLADGGIYVHAFNPVNGEIHWTHRVNTVPQKGFYENSGLEFDAFDILHQEGDNIAMSRWMISQDGQKQSVDKWHGFSQMQAGEGATWVPRGFWSFGPRHQHRFPGEAARRPLCVFRDGSTFGYLNSTTTLFRRDFKQDETFNRKWITGWEFSQKGRKGQKPYRTHRIAENSRWQVDPYGTPETKPGRQRYNNLHALALATGNNRLYAAHRDGRMKILDASSGAELKGAKLPAPAWDGLAIANQRVFMATQTGEVICLGN